MRTHSSRDVARKADDTRRTRSRLVWAIGVLFLLALLGSLFFYDGRDFNTAPGPNTPNVVNNPAGSK